MTKFLFFISLVSALVCSPNSTSAQILEIGQSTPEGVVVYSLPSTSLHLSVEATREHYSPGPYAKYAKKYLGVDVPTSSGDHYNLSHIKLTPYLEADPNIRAIADINAFGSENASAFFKFSSQGMIFLSDEQKGKEDYWRFPTLTEDGFNQNSSKATETFTSAETTLYKRVKNTSGGYDRVAIQQSQVVQKSIEKKAQEAASMIFHLRKKRLEIITGDTDATFTGNALGHAVDEIGRLEQDYLSLFLGQTESSTQKMYFDVIPNKDEARQLYVAFRMSDSDGILVPSDVSGRPIVLELTPDSDTTAVNQVLQPTPSSSSKSSRSKGAVNAEIFYRIPNICTVKILDGQELLLQSRVPIYQLGETMSFPFTIN